MSAAQRRWFVAACLLALTAVALGAFGWELGPGFWIALAAIGVLVIGGLVAGAIVRRRRDQRGVPGA